MTVARDTNVNIGLISCERSRVHVDVCTSWPTCPQVTRVYSPCSAYVFLPRKEDPGGSRQSASKKDNGISVRSHCTSRVRPSRKSRTSASKSSYPKVSRYVSLRNISYLIFFQDLLPNEFFITKNHVHLNNFCRFVLRSFITKIKRAERQTILVD